MTYPASDVNTTNMDAGTDFPATARTDLLDLSTKFNLLRNHLSPLAAATNCDAAGNLGLGVVPSAWSGMHSMEVGPMVITSDVNSAHTGINYYNTPYNGGSALYKASGYAANYWQNKATGSHVWQIAPAGTAGSPITFTQEMTLDASGTLTATRFSGNGAQQIGEICMFAVNSAPTGFLKANGASLSTTTYAALFAVIGYTYGGAGASFTLPDLRGEFIRGFDDARGVDAGRTIGSAQAEAFKSHAHTQTSTSSTGGGYVTQKLALGAIGSETGDNNPTQAAGGAETRPRNIALLACIKY
jgi:microcystin-dependent protein